MRESTTSDGEFTLLQVSVAPNGDLVMQRVDAGPSVGQTYAHEDVELTRTIKREYVARVALELIADRFTTDAEFGAWLKGKGIPSDT